MGKSLLLGTLLGGLTAFLWSSISWEILGWHEKPLLHFNNEEEVSAVLLSHTTQSGTYLLPSTGAQDGMAPDQKKAAQAALLEQFRKGPILFAALRREGYDSYAKGLLLQLLSLMAAAFLLSWLLLQTQGLGYRRRVAFLSVVGLAAGVISDLPNWNWWGFSGVYTVVNVVDFTLTWLLAGLVIAKVVNPRTKLP
jgi:hypothetical protein